MDWTAALVEQLDFYYTGHLRPRLAGLTDDGYLWEPAPGAWSLRPGADGRWQLDGLPVEPPIPPVTTIAWRVVHVGRDVLGKRARAFFARDTLPAPVPDDAVMYDDRYWPEPMPATAAEALAFLDRAYGLWRDGVAALDADGLERPLGPRGGPYAGDAMGSLVLHINREVMAHGAEICLLRDLFRAQEDAADPLIAAALRGDAATVTWLLRGGSVARASLAAEAAGLGRWEVVRALAASGADVSGGSPSALHFAAAAGDAESARALLAAGADTTATDPQYGLTAQGWADYFGHPEVAALIAAGG